MLLYREISELYLVVRDLVTPILCLFGWLLIGKAAAKQLHAFTHWFLPSIIGATFVVAGLLLEAFVSFHAPQNHALIAAVYLCYLASVAFHLVSFARLWKTISRLPPSPGEMPPTHSID